MGTSVLSDGTVPLASSRKPNKTIFKSSAGADWLVQWLGDSVKVPVLRISPLPSLACGESDSGIHIIHADVHCDRYPS